MMHYSVMSYQKLWRCAFLVGLLYALAVTPVLAHGSDESVIQLQDVHLADYRLTVMTAPRVLLVGTLHVVVLVSDPTGQRFKIIQQMTVEAVPLTGVGSRQIGLAVPMLTPLGSHEAQLDLTQLGQYQIQLHIPGSVQPVTFEIEVVSGIWMEGMILALVSVTAVAALWLVKEGVTVWHRHPRQESRAIELNRKVL